MNIYKKCKVVIIPTGNEMIEKGELIKASISCSNPVIEEGELALAAYTIENNLQSGWKSQYLYILSDDEIQVGDWFISCYISHPEPIRVESDMHAQDVMYARKKHNLFLKIIATTDPKLNLPSPSQAFIKKYVELEGIDEIMVQFSKETILTVDPPSGWKYGFPKQAPLDGSDMLKWFVEQGYPQSEIDAFGDNFTYGFSEYQVETLKVSKNNTIIIKAVEVDNQKNYRSHS